MLSHASQEVSRASQQIGFAIAPAAEPRRSSTSTSCRSTAARCWWSSSSTGGHVSHKVIAPAEAYDLTELQQAANYLNSEFKGQSLLAVRQAVLSGCARSACSTTS